MVINGWAGTVYKITSYIMKAAYVNLLWILFSLLGLLIAGIFPATIALFTVMRKLISGEDVHILAVFWQTYKSVLMEGNMLGYALSGIGVLLVADLWFLSLQSSAWSSVLYYILVVLFGLYLLLLVSFFPVYVHYDLRLFGYIKQALFLVILRPLHSLLMLCSLVAVWVMMYFSPGLILFFGVSASAYLLMFVALGNFSALRRKVL
ncbi:YesL family protein [Gracilibacillus phocaeensis]|uniref:YesL family protein n=1 Tax=Gracilibacillus phocaeensis TaxID=2042304 RepID=UPI001032737B|nr:DUF624 domain-containing protein [Gracilibacillus phocaeensis]